MILNVLILFLSALIAGLLAFKLTDISKNYYKFALVFAGAYLFAITIIHIMPELFVQAISPTTIGVYVLLGFFIQHILEYFTDGAEHGHVHKHEHEHKHGGRSALIVLSAMVIHSLPEGSLLVHPGTEHSHNHDTDSILFGIVLHKAPAAFALMSIILCQLNNKKLAIFYLVLFAMASPIGMILGDFFIENATLANENFTILMAIVSGNFLHISTTIVFESSEDHRFNAKKLGIAMVGALIAVGAEYWF